jgi:hypothetical protein
MKILIHCMSGYTAFALELIKFARASGTPLDWSIVLYSNGEGVLDKLTDQVGTENVLDLQQHLNTFMEKADMNLDEMVDFPASIFECVSTSKVHFGHISLQHQDRRYQLKIIADTYAIYKEYLLRNRPDYVFFPLVEQYDSMVLYHLCHELYITPIIYGHARNLGVAYFTDSLNETLPAYAFSSTPSAQMQDRAASFLKSFREMPTRAFEVPYRPKPEEVIDTSYLRRNLYSKALQFFQIRLGMLNMPLLNRLITAEPHVVDRFTFIHNVRIHFFGITKRYRELKKSLRKIHYDIRSVDGLPAKFVYYPLQYTPESSINTPAPYFSDQLRGVDLILSVLPPHHYLVVRDHFAKLTELDRKHIKFYSSLRERASVLLADPAIQNLEILKCASLTVSVTGTSCLEAFLLGKPSLHLGKVFFTDWISRFDCFSTLNNDVHNAIESVEVPMEKIIDLVARVFSIGNDFVLYSVGGGPFGDADLVMNTRNFRVFLEALQKHIKYLKSE